MDKIKGFGRGVAKVFGALLAALAMPVLIWVGLGTALYQKHQSNKAAAKMEADIADIFAGEALKRR